MSRPFNVLSFNTLASFEVALHGAKLWQAGPDGYRLCLPNALLDGICRVLVSDIVGESPFQSWGGKFELRLFVDSLPVGGGEVPHALLSGEGFVQLAAGEIGGPDVFVFNVLCVQAA